MQVDFKNAIQHQRPDDIIKGNSFLFFDLALPEFVKDLYQDIIQSQKSRQVDIEGGFAFGGMFSDKALGLEPKDYDIYLCSPKWVDFVKRYQRECEQACGFKESRELAEERDGWIIGYNFPLTLISDNFKILYSDPFGEYIEFNGTYTDQAGKIRLIDIKVGSKPIEPQDFMTFVPAPVMAVAASLSSDGVAYHRDFEDHVRRKIMCTTNPHSPSLIEKAERKGLTVMTPQQVSDLTSRPLDLGGEGHEDSLGVPTSLKPKLGPTII